MSEKMSDEMIEHLSAEMADAEKVACQIVWSRYGELQLDMYLTTDGTRFFSFGAAECHQRRINRSKES